MSEREEIVEAIRSTGTITKAAKRLGIHRRTLQDRMRALGLGESKERPSQLGGLGKRGRPKKRFKNRARNYAIGAAAIAVAAGIVLSRKGTTNA